MQRRSAAIVAALVAVGVLAAWLGGGSRSRTDVRIATAGRGGSYFPLGESIAEILNQHLGDRLRASAIETAGSIDNVGRLEAGAAELAIIQNDTPSGPAVRTIAPLYDEVMQTVVRAGVGIERLEDLRGHTVSIGAEGSGTAILAQRLLAHFGALEGTTIRHLSTMEGVDAFANGSIDAVFIVSGLRSEAVATLLGRSDARLLSLGAVDGAGSALEGLRFTHPFVERAVIPARTYGAQPEGPVGTIGVAAVLVARASLDESLVHDVTEALFENRVLLTSRHGAMIRLSERFDPADLQAALHAGADAYLRRDEPPLYVEYADVISLAITIALTLGSGFLAMRQWLERRMKNRIDGFYVEIRRLAASVEKGETSPQDGRKALLALGARAFEELVDERLEANQSFTIFQDYLAFEMRRIERAEARESMAPPPRDA